MIAPAPLEPSADAILARFERYCIEVSLAPYIRSHRRGCSIKRRRRAILARKRRAARRVPVKVAPRTARPPA